MNVVPKIFIDANILFTAVNSPSGGSGLICTLACKEKIKIATSKHVLLESEKNIRDKLESRKLDRFYDLLLDMPLEVISIMDITLSEIIRLETLLPMKDVPIFAGVLFSQCSYFITLDRRHFLTNKKLQQLFPQISIMNPGEFLMQYKNSLSSSLD